MQEITERMRDGSVRRDTLVGLESAALMEAFRARRQLAEDRLQAGETKSLTITESRRIGRNDPCPCGSRAKFKQCCGARLAADDERVKD
jgi:hypothetical protein